MASISLNHIKKVYPGDIEVISDLNLQIKDKEFVVLVGPSGCGKSTTLRMIAGLEEISDGEMYIGDRKVNDVAPKDRDIAMVFQNYALYPHMTVYKNMAFALKLRKTPKDEIDRKVHEAAKVLDIEHLLDRKRTYYRLLRQIVSHGQEREELTDTRTVSEIVKAYAMFERGLMYDWCLSGGEYSLVQYAQQMMPLFLDGFRKK